MIRAQLIKLVALIALYACVSIAQTTPVKDRHGSGQSIAPSAVFQGTGFGPIPDSTGGPASWAAPRNVTFNVQGIFGQVRNVILTVTMDHTFIGDLDVTLSGPGGQVNHVVFSRVGASSAGTAWGDSSNLSGTYTFGDFAIANPWTVATLPACGDACAVVPQAYRTTFPGPTTNPANPTDFGPAYTPMIEPNGTWTLRIRDGSQGDIGSVTAASLVVESLKIQTPFDFDGDDKTDFSVFVPGSGEWWYLRSSDNGNRAFQFGTATDIITPADFTGDTRTDIAVFRPSTGYWYVLRSEDHSYYAFPFGQNGDIPVPADYDGDFKADPAVYRPSSGRWYVNRSMVGFGLQVWGGAPGDIPIPADYDGDNRMDVAIYRPSLNPAEWWVSRSLGGNIVVRLGAPGDKSVIGDFDRDLRADFTVFRPSTGEWTVVRSQTYTYYSFPFGQNGDIPVSGDFDGDGYADPAVFRPSTAMWFVNRSTGGTSFVPFGTSSSVPVPAAYLR